MNPPAPSMRSWRVFLTVTGLGLLLAFVCPVFVPTPPAASSEAYLFGFQNRVFLLLFLAVVAWVALYTKFAGLKVAPRIETWREEPGGVSLNLLAIYLAVSAVLCAAIIWLIYPLGGLNDGTYFLDRIHKLAAGQTPFRDFEFVYGSGPLYASVFLARTLHLSPDAGYYILWTISNVLGIFLLWQAIRWIDAPPAGKRAVFLVIGAPMVLLALGGQLNYAVMRYTLALFAVMGFCRIDRDDRPVTRIGATAFLIAMGALLLSYSPEEGLAFLVASSVYLPVRRWFGRRPFVPELSVLLVVYGALLFAVAHAGTFATMKRIGAGAFNLPVYPGPVILLALACVLGLVFFVMTGELRKRSQSGVAFIVIYAIGMLPGALGRCDVIHVFGYLMPALTAGLLFAWQWRTARRLSMAVVLVTFLVAPLIFQSLLGPPVFSKALLNHLYAGGRTPTGFSATIDRLGNKAAVAILGPVRGPAKIAALRAAVSATSMDPHAIFPGASATLYAPFRYMPNKMSGYDTPTLDEGYFMGTLNILTPREVQRKISELRDHPERDLVVSLEGLNGCAPVYGSRSEIRQLLMLPWVPQPKHTDTMLMPFCDYLRAHYRFVYQPSPPTFGYGLMREIHRN